MQKSVQENLREDIPPIFQDIPRSDTNTFTEYILSRPVTFAHKCEDFMASSCMMAIMAGIGAIGAVSNPDIIPSHEKVALGFVCTAGVCLIGTVLSGIAGGVSECLVERKKRILQEMNVHTRD